MWKFLLGIIFAFFLYKFLLLGVQMLIARFGRSIGLGVTWLSNHGEYAVITGATGTMGSRYVLMMGSMKFNLVLISNNGEKLKDVAMSIKEKYKLTNVVTIEADFTKEESFEQIKNQIKSLSPIVVLVNAAGVHQSNKSFDKFSSQTIIQILQVNVYAPVRMTEIVLPEMISKNRGTIINFSSLIGEYPFSDYTLYGASKAFNKSFSQALALECKKYNIKVQTVSPLFVRSKAMPELKSSNCLDVSAGEVGFEAMRVVGIESLTHAHWKHRLAATGMIVMCFLLGRKLTSCILNLFRSCVINTHPEQGSKISSTETSLSDRSNSSKQTRGSGGGGKESSTKSISISEKSKSKPALKLEPLYEKSKSKSLSKGSNSTFKKQAPPPFPSGTTTTTITFKAPAPQPSQSSKGSVADSIYQFPSASVSSSSSGSEAGQTPNLSSKTPQLPPVPATNLDTQKISSKKE